MNPLTPLEDAMAWALVHIHDVIGSWSWSIVVLTVIVRILLVPLTGHTRGHAGVAVRADGGWLLHAGDAYFFHGEMDPAGYRCPPGLRLYQRMMEVDRRARLANQERLRGLVKERAGQVRILCAHDAVEFERWAAANPPARPSPRPPRT